MSRVSALILALMAAASVHAASGYDPHLLLLSWPGRQEVVPATTLDICRAAIEAINHRRWLADDPPTEARCVSGNGFRPAETCIQGFNC